MPTDLERLQRLVRELQGALVPGVPTIHEALVLNEITEDIQAVIQSIRDDYGLDV